MSAANLQGVLLGMGNPLLDISATVEQDILDKYDVKLNNAILAEEKHLPVYSELVEKYNPQFIAGGATQNSIRVCQVRYFFSSSFFLPSQSPFFPFSLSPSLSFFIYVYIAPTLVCNAFYSTWGWPPAPPCVYEGAEMNNSRVDLWGWANLPLPAFNISPLQIPLSLYISIYFPFSHSLSPILSLSISSSLSHTLYSHFLKPQWMLQAEGATSFIGCVGKDEYAAKLRTAAEADGVHVSYLEDESTPTGTCACLIKDQERSLIANLAAANNYKLDHLQTEESKKIVEAAKYYYISGFFLTVSPPSIMEVAKHAHANGKTFAMNLSAPFITQFFADPLNAALPYVDILFGNESEAEAFGKQHGYDDLSVEGIAKKIANLPKENADKPRIVIITQGSNATVVATGETVTSYPVPSLEKDAIVDSNGAGDAFVGGFLSQLVQGKSIESAVNAGHYSAGLILGVSGTVLSGKPKTDF